MRIFTERKIENAEAEKEKTRQARQELTEFRESMEALASKEQEEKIALKMQKLQEKQTTFVVCLSLRLKDSIKEM